MFAVVRNGWNNHSISTNQSYSLIQLYTMGMVSVWCEGVPALDYYAPVNDDYGIYETKLLDSFDHLIWTLDHPPLEP